MEISTCVTHVPNYFCRDSRIDGHSNHNRKERWIYAKHISKSKTALRAHFGTLHSNGIYLIVFLGQDAICPFLSTYINQVTYKSCGAKWKSWNEKGYEERDGFKTALSVTCAWATFCLRRLYLSPYHCGRLLLDYYIACVTESPLMYSRLLATHIRFTKKSMTSGIVFGTRKYEWDMVSNEYCSILLSITINIY